MPFYTLWLEGTLGRIVYSILHCTGGDILIALSSLMLAVVITGSSHWPEEKYKPVLFLTVVFGVVYCAYSEWLNVYIYRNWGYSEQMPLLSVGQWQIGLLPLLQWIVLPTTSLWLTRKLLINRKENV